MSHAIVFLVGLLCAVILAWTYDRKKVNDELRNFLQQYASQFFNEFAIICRDYSRTHGSFIGIRSDERVKSLANKIKGRVSPPVYIQIKTSGVDAEHVVATVTLNMVLERGWRGFKKPEVNWTMNLEGRQKTWWE